MKLAKSGESLAGIIIAVFILSFAMFGVLSVINFNRTVMTDYTEITDLSILKGNSRRIVDSLNLDNIKINEPFYIYNDTDNNTFVTFTGSANERYKYIDIYGNVVDLENYEGKVFIREYVKIPSAVQYALSPNSINNLVLHIDASNLDSQENNTYSSGSAINIINNLKDDTSISIVGSPAIYSIDSGNSSIEFLGNGKFNLESDVDITGNESCDVEPSFFEEKSFVFAFQTGDDITTEQIILKQGDDFTGYNFYIFNGEFYASAYNQYNNTKYWCTNNTPYEWTSGNKKKTINLLGILPNTLYFMTIVQDSSNKDSSNNYLDLQNTFKVYQNGVLMDNLIETNIRPQVEHKLFSIGGDTMTTGKYFKGKIYEIASWNHALNENEVRSFNNYLNQKWKNKASVSGYSSIEVNIFPYNN